MFFINKMILVLVIQYELNFWYVNNFMLYCQKGLIGTEGVNRYRAG